ncbi:MAG: long-chain-fatty-acid--CoA ligase [Alphaproteobacteria bacterium]
MHGLMQNWPLLVHKIIDHAALNHGAREVVTRTLEGPLHRTSYDEIRSRAKLVAKALTLQGIRRGDRVATMAWNTHRHVEAWYGIMGMGGVCHTINPRLFPPQIEYIANHAGDRALFFDSTFAGIVAELAPKLTSCQLYVALCARGNLPEAKIPNLVAYEDFIGSVDDDFEWAQLDENDACGLCYTSGTTGNPKGVLYTHRSNVLHTFLAAQPDTFGLSSADCVLPVVPMFHANAWGIVFNAPMAGAKMVLPGAKLDGASLYELLEKEEVTCSAAVPTVWMNLLAYLEQNELRLSTLKRVVIGGAACPRALIETFENTYGVQIAHSWGMTEMSPLGTVGKLKAGQDEMPYEEKYLFKLKQGRPPFGVEMKIVGDDDRELPRDGKTFGRLMVRGPAIARAYFKEENVAVNADGWFDTGDVATLDAEGFMQITDRSKDVIKSGGEWISSIAIENIAACHPAVAEAAVIGVPHLKWNERPLLIAVLKKDARATRDDILSFLSGTIARWWMPDDVVFVDEIPHTATGKVQKTALRDRFRDYKSAATVGKSAP